MPRQLLIFISFCLAWATAEPVKLILDTDMSGDADDVGTLAMLHALADLGECEILATVTNRRDKTNASAAATDAINTYYGRPGLPIGTGKAIPTDLRRTSQYTRALRDGFPNDIGPDDQAPDALDVLRRVLRAQPDGSVTICSVGALSNLAELCEKEPALIRQKVARLVVMGGEIPHAQRAETNIGTHIAAARSVADNWPGPIYWQGFRVGHRVWTGVRLTETPQNNPVRRAYELRYFGKRVAIKGGQPSYDQCAALYAVRGSNPDLWGEDERGKLRFDEKGWAHFSPETEARDRLVRLACPPEKLAKIIESLMIKPPATRP
ncbi:MAG: nucleoside hydrolase [Verrucomicrobiales bacterium]